MNYEYFGKFLQELRLSRNMTREQLAEDICTPKQIYRIEKGLFEPSLYLINQLSIKFKLDLNEYYKMYFTNNTIVGLEGVNSINTAIENNDVALLKSLVDKYENLDEFKSGTNLQAILYGKALCSALIDVDYTTSLSYCLKGIQIECPDFQLETISKNYYSNLGIVLLICMSQNYFAMDKYNDGKHILCELLYVLENYVLDSPYLFYKPSPFAKNAYLVILFNLSYHLMNNKEHESALHYVDTGISFSLKVHNLRYLPQFMFMKFKLLYEKMNYEEAKKYFEYTLSLYKITNKEDKYNDLINSSKTEYPKLFS